MFKNSEHIEDSELLNKFYSDSDNRWIGLLLERYTLLLLGVCMKYLKNEEEAKDAVQQIFLKVIVELAKYRVHYFKSWLYMITKNHCLMLLRCRSSVPVELSETLAVEDLDQSEMYEKDTTLNLLQAGLQELNEAQQQCISLFYLKKKSYQQIAIETGFSLLQVKSCIQNGKRNLRLIVERKLKQIHG